MKRLLLAALAMALFAASLPADAATPRNGRAISEDEQAVQIVQRMMAAHGGFHRWSSRETCSFVHSMTAPGYEDDPWVSREVIEQSTRRTYQDWPRDDARVAFDGKRVWSLNWQRGNPPKFMVNMAYYFLNLPWITQDAGVYLEASGTGRFPNAEKDYLTVRMTFGEEIGDTPDDYYVLFVDPDTFTLKAAEYVVTFAPMLDLFGAPADTKFLGPFWKVYTEWTEVDGLTVPTRYDTYMADGNVMGIHEVEEWSFRAKFDESRMRMPADAVVDDSDPSRRGQSQS